MTNMDKTIVTESINTIRFLSIDGVQKANSGHPGMPMGCAPLAYNLYKNVMNHNPANPTWVNRDRFVLSGGHGSMLLYSTLHLSGYEVSMDDLKNFRQWGSKTAGHPEYGEVPGVETTTGPLGQGFANAVGMATAYSFMAAKFNKDDAKIIDHNIYAEAGDGDIMEGVSHEAASFAGHNKLSNLIVFYDDNNITIDGKVSLSMSEDVGKRFEAYKWYVQTVKDVNDLDELNKAIENAKAESERPSFIITKTHIGFGSPNKQDTSSAHGSPLGLDEIKLTKEKLGCENFEPFFVSENVRAHFSDIPENGKKLEAEWKKLFESYKEKYPEDAKLFEDVIAREFGAEWVNKLPKFENWGDKVATRATSGVVLNAICNSLPTLFGGSADIAPSNNTYLKEHEKFSPANYAGRNIHFGIREHAMGSIMNGMALYGGVIPYGGTFMIFSEYMRPPIRMASIMNISPKYVFTHDSIGLGEDGPTHQPVEQLAALRAVPGLIVLRPADANETVYSWKVAIEENKRPVALALTRQGLPIMDRTKYAGAENTMKGAYVLRDCDGDPDIILMASGSEVELIMNAVDEIESKGNKVRVVSFPSWELFDQQSEEYKERVLPKKVTSRLSVEAGIAQGWQKYVGSFGDIISLEHFGASAPANILFEKFGFTVDNVVRTAISIIEKNK